MRDRPKKFVDQNSALQAACDTPVALFMACVYPREGCRPVTPVLMPGSTGLKTFNLVLRTEVVTPASILWVFFTLNRYFHPTASVNSVSVLISHPREIQIIWSPTVRK